MSDVKRFMKTEENLKWNLKNIPILFRIHLRHKKKLHHTKYKTSLYSVI